MSRLEIDLVLITGWARPVDGGWEVLDADGTGAHWIAATPEQADALEAALVTYPTLAIIHAGLMDTAKAHRADCATLRPNPCSCPQLEPHRIAGPS